MKVLVICYSDDADNPKGVMTEKEYETLKDKSWIKRTKRIEVSEDDLPKITIGNVKQFIPTSVMDPKLKMAIDTIFDSLACVWNDNGNIMAEAVRDSVVSNLAEITGMTELEIQKRVEEKVEEAQ
jgi:hypothetical protein